jgi:hypothetical protein
MEELAFIAKETNVAIEFVAHTRKANGEQVTADDTRGASAVHDKTRSLRTVNRMSETEGEKLGFQPRAHMDFIRVDNGKANMSKRGASGHEWLRLVSVEIDSGDEVQVCEAWSWPKVEQADEPEAFALAPDIADAIMAKFAGVEFKMRVDPQTSDWAGNHAAAVLDLDLGLRDDKKLAAQAID